MNIDFSKLTRAQIDSMNYHAFPGSAVGWPGGPKTLSALVKRGFLIQEMKTSTDSFGMKFNWFEYFMPIHIHLAWCSEVSKDVSDEELQ